MAARELHVVFTPSAAGELRKALKATGRNGDVVSLFDCLSFGPINPHDPAARCKWVEEELDYTGWENVITDSRDFWDRPYAHRGPIIVWTSRRSADEYAGFLEWLSRFGDLDFEVVDVTTATVGHRGPDGNISRRPAISLGILHSHEILELVLMNSAEKLSAALHGHYRTHWDRLRAENAPLRVLSGGELVSAPITFFDQLLLSHAKSDWQKVAMVVARALTEFWDTQTLQTGDLVLAARVRSLVASGFLESRGDLAHIRSSQVRKL